MGDITMDTLQKLLEDSIKDLYSAEKQFLKAMPKLAEASQDVKLKAGIEAHIKETEGHVSRLEEVAKLLEIKPTGIVCKAAKGLVEEAEEHLEEYKPGPVLDAAIVECAQKNEHYEICAYGAVMAWAKELGMTDAQALLEETLAEEKATDAKLTKVAQTSVNAAAAGSAAAGKGPRAKLI
jgi:ferritin-like metal-binding protein YciE